MKLPFLSFLLSLLCFSCGLDSIRSLRANRPDDIMAYLPEPAPAAAAAAAKRTAILDSGNGWTAGLPGFGENALRALSGIYRVEEGEGGFFRVWMTRELLYYGQDWQPRLTSEYRVLQKQEGGLLAAVSVNEIWTAVIQFPPENAVSPNDIDRIISLYSGRFLYFLALAARPSDISLPAILEF